VGHRSGNAQHAQHAQRAFLAAALDAAVVAGHEHGFVEAHRAIEAARRIVARAQLEMHARHAGDARRFEQPLQHALADAEPAGASRVAAAAAAPVSPGAGLPPSEATIVSVSRSRIAFSTRGASYFQPRPDSMKSRDMSATAWASRGSASRMVIARWVMKSIVPCSAVNFDGLRGAKT